MTDIEAALMQVNSARERPTSLKPRASLRGLVAASAVSRLRSDFARTAGAGSGHRLHSVGGEDGIAQALQHWHTADLIPQTTFEP